MEEECTVNLTVRYLTKKWTLLQNLCHTIILVFFFRTV